MPRVVAVALLWFQVQFGALRALERIDAPWGDVAVALVWVASAVAAWAFLRGRVPVPTRALRTPWPSVVLCVLVAAVALFVYPEVDGRRSTGGGSDADDAVVLVVDRIRDGLDPFGEDTYLGNPPTTGPGSILWAAPFPTRRAYACGVVAALAGALVVLRRRHGSWEVPSLAAVVVGASVPFWEGVAQGTDHLAMAAWLAVVVGSTAAPPAAVGAGAGVLATWRAAYLHLPLLLAITHWRDDRRRALVIGIAGTALALTLHAVLLAWTDGGWDAYDPVQQLAVKSDEDLEAWGRVLLAAGVAASAAVVVVEAARRTPREDVAVLAGIGGPLAAVAVAGAIAGDDPAGWSEASYLLPTLVLASVTAARAAVGSRAP
jgi:hypothetical protein